MPGWTHHLLQLHGRHWTIGLAILFLAVLLSSFAKRILVKLVGRFHRTQAAGRPPVLRIVSRIRRPTQFLVLLAAIAFVLPLTDLPPHWLAVAQKTVGVAWFVALGWLMVAAVYCFEDFLLLRFDVSVADNLRARRARTQVQLMRRMVIVLIVVVDAGLVLSVFRDSQIWHYGAGLLASAGLASLVLATAAKSSASNLLAGMQIALTEPIRLDDVVIVEGQWGRIEEITTTYVVVAIWDQRRLIVPLSYFIENSFQNWTRNSAELLGYPYLYVDYSVPVEPLRQEFRRVLESTPLWDKRVCVLQVTDLSSSMMQIRCLFSVRNSSDQWDLSCLVREKMIEFIRANYPDAFPRTRFSAVAEFPGAADGGGPIGMSGRTDSHTPQDAPRKSA
ncbi:MAG: mechanosensitive ion channel domain-containing protein [Acidobacteriaceae bacterium]